MNIKEIVKYFQHKKQTKKNKVQNFKTITEDCNKNYNIFVSHREEETLNETEMRQIMEGYGEVKKVRIKFDRYGYQQQRAMICLK